MPRQILPAVGENPYGPKLNAAINNISDSIDQHAHNVKSYGALGTSSMVSGTTTTAAMTAGSTTLTATANLFTSTAVVGMTISVDGAGANGTALVTTIAARTSNTQITLATPAITTVTASTRLVWGPDDTEAIKAAIAACPSGGTIVIPPGQYLVTSTIALGATKKLSGGAQHTGCVIRGVTTGMTILTYGSSATVEGIMFDGCYRAYWGIKADYTVSNPHVSRVRVEYCLQDGIVAEGLQNAIYVDCLSQHNLGANYALYNGCASIKFFNCKSRTQSEGVAGTRQILIAEKFNDPRLSASTQYGLGNRQISFFGGIFEQGNVNPYQIEISGQISGYISFTENELNGGLEACIRFAPDPTQGKGMLYINRSQFAMNGQQLAILAESGSVRYQGVSYSGLANNGVMKAVGSATIRDLFPNILDDATSLLQTGPGAWGGSGTGSTSFDTTKQRLVVTSAASNAGARTLFTSAWQYAKQYRFMKVVFNIQNITGATEVTLNASLANSPFRRALKNFGPGENTYVFEMVGDEVGLMLSPATSVASTFELCYLTCEVL